MNNTLAYALRVQMPCAGNMLRAALVVAVLILAGRLSGFAREWLLAVQAGAGASTDVAIILLTFPDLLVGLLLGGAVSAALIPAFKRLGAGQDSALYLQTQWIVGAFFSLLALLLAALAPTVLRGLAPGLPDPLITAHVSDFHLVTLALPLAALSGVAVAWLNAHERFVAGAAGTLVFNLIVILCLLWAGPAQTVAAVVIGGVLGALLRLLMQLASTRRDWRPPATRAWLIDANLVRQFLASFGFLTLLVLLPPLARAIASYCDEGALSLFNYAYKLVELPMGVVVGAIGTVLLPRLAGDLAQTAGLASAQASLAAGMRAALLLSLGIAIPAFFFADVLIQVAYFSAAFSTEQTQSLARLTAIAFLFMPCQGLLTLYGPAFVARDRTRPLLWSAALMLALFAVAAPAARAMLGLPGVMLAYGVTYLAGALLLSACIDPVFGPGTLRAALHNGRRGLLLPALGAALIALVGDKIGVDLVARSLFALASFATFLVSAMLLDRGLRRDFGRLRRRTTH